MYTYATESKTVGIDPQIIEHTNLVSSATEDDIALLCAEAIKYGFGHVCVRPKQITNCVENLKGKVGICTVIGFPINKNSETTYLKENKDFWEHLRSSPQAKTIMNCKYRPNEIDMVIDCNAALEGDWHLIEHQIKQVKNIIKHIPLKVILEASLLSRDQIGRACSTSILAGADFVKTSTGYLLDKHNQVSGATVADVRWMKRACKGKARIKAAGGIETIDDALRMVVAGADRLGCSKSVQIITGEA